MTPLLKRQSARDRKMRQRSAKKRRWPRKNKKGYASRKRIRRQRRRDSGKMPSASASKKKRPIS